MKRPKPISTRRLWPHPKNGPWIVDLTWMEIDGRFECVGAAIRSCAVDAGDMDFTGDLRPVTTTAWRDVPIAGIIDEERQLHHDWLASKAANPVPELRDKIERWSPVSRPGPRPKHNLGEVATVYTTAWRAGTPPTKAVADELNVSRSAAAKLVARARTEGLLPATDKGRAQGAKPATKKARKR